MRTLFRIFISMALSFLITASLCPAGGAQVVLNEILADPLSDWDGDGEVNFRDDEWIEVINLGDSPVDLSAYLISDGEGEPVWRYGYAGMLGPGEVRVTYGSDSKAWEQANGFPAYGLSLNNAGDRLTLYCITGPDTVPADAYMYTDLAANNDRSIGRSARLPGAWNIFDLLNPCTDSCDPPGNGCMPTPGSANECITPARADSWGAIKTYYR
ncbi:MAG TPA: lamin tail domain-containing protein [Patescibacteria group bacterium]|nr:lamin tail domain-containing protein [Patescibacteria group bacterium]